ncbi:MAG: Type VI secretion system, TssC, VipB [Bacteriophage sp.]|nr:MAG: Type VI secretion system, TssC, VipB [Bacteriophage sp.]
MINHGIYIQEEATSLTAPVTGDCSVPVVIGTAPVNMGADPKAAVNVPILANSASEAIEALGYSADFKNYSLCQMMYLTSNVYQVSPVVYINVLDPAKHNKALAETEVQVNDLQAVLEEEGIILDGLTVKSGASTLTADTDYSVEFNESGHLVVILTGTGAGKSATSLKISGKQLDPSKVTKDDIIGTYSNGKETGMQLIRQVYPKLNIVPGLLIAPGWSKIPEVGVALSAKAANINGVFKAQALVDLDTTKATKYTDCKQVKESSGFTSAFGVPMWPCDRIGDLIFAKSATMAAMIAYQDAANDNVPNLSPSNKMLGVTGQCLEDGTEVVLDQDQGNTVNSFGVLTAINMNGWRSWGNYTGAYPSVNDAKDIWVTVRRMFNWHGNTFIQTYHAKVDDPMNPVLVESVVDSENIRCGAYAPKYWAGASMEYRKSDNPQTSILAGKVTFRQKIAPYTPAQEIVNVLSYDTDMLAAALGGE